MHNGHEWGQVIRQDCLRNCHLSESHITLIADLRYHHRASTSLNSPLLTCSDYGFMRMSPYPYTSISLIQLETRLIRPRNVFPVINSLMSVLAGPGEA
ncbi:uncharacterized protein TNCV_4113641 [Trichonephila clavipes]|nr:uncharacterized protein TNCV_4113641 [Trichonephila clavipes]